MEASEIVQICLTPEQAEVLAPFVLATGAKRENAIFAVVVPEWSAEPGETTWQLQAIVAPAKVGHKIKRLILETSKPRAVAAKTPRVERIAKVMTAAAPTKRAQNDPGAISQKPDSALRTGKLAAKAMLAKAEQPALFPSSLMED
jgi:hypothetical protein